MLAPAHDHLSVELDLNVRDFATSDFRQCAHSGNHLAPISAVTLLISHYSKKKISSCFTALLSTLLPSS